VIAESRRVLVLVEDAQTRQRLETLLARTGYAASLAGDERQALRALARQDHDAAILDVGRVRGGPVTARLRQHAPAIPILVLAEPDRVPEAVASLREGADDYLLAPPDAVELRTRLGRLLDQSELGSRLALLQDEVSRNYGYKNLVSHSPAMRDVIHRVARVAPMRATVLVTGESGVGKELVARAIHFNSPRRDFPFVAINCAAIPPNLIESELFGHEKGAFTGAHARNRGKFEIANRGTLFLDEIGETDVATQVKLLRVLEEREFMRVGGDRSIRVDVRVIAATNADLEELVREGRFRQDLYYRLKVVSIPVPPLRERRKDIPTLVDGFLHELARSNAVPARSITDDAVSALEEYRWPGNVRELKNVLESLLVSSPGDVIRREDLPPSIQRQGAGPEPIEVRAGTTLAEMEAALIRRTLEETGGNRTHSAALLGIGVRTLQRKIAELGIRIPPRRRRPRRRPAS
jgi:DNA-binding NtrC family response regulator